MKSEEFQKLHGKKKTLRKKSNSDINASMTASFLRQVKEAGFPKPLCEFKFMSDRKFRIDFLFAAKMLAVEIEGFGHHHLGTFRVNMEKYNELTFAGIHLLRFTVAEVMNGTAIQQLKRIL